MNYSATENKTLSIDLSEDRLLSIASDYLDAHNYIGTLRMLNKNAELNGNTEESYMLYAEAFDDMGLYEKCINAWFKYIDYAGAEAEFAEAYEGLAIAFLNTGRDDLAALYYNKLLMETDATLTDDDRRDIIDAFLTGDKPALRMAYPPSIADYSAEIDKGLSLMRAADYDGAISEFKKVGEGNEKYVMARNLISMCLVITDKCDEAEEICNNTLSIKPDDVQTLTILAAVKTQQKKPEESRALAEKLISLDVTNTEDVYKIATVACENGMHEQAYELFVKLNEELSYDFSILYFRAVSAFNCGKWEDSAKTFGKLLDIYPDAITAKYYKSVISSRISAGEQGEPISYFYRMPTEEREANLKILAMFQSLGKSHTAQFLKHLDIADNIRWCFDEAEGQSSKELQKLGAACAVKANEDDLLRDILLDAEIDDGVKIETLSLIAMRNSGSSYGVVLHGIYRFLDIPKLNLPTLKRKNFLKIYSILIARFGVLDENYSFILQGACEDVYERLANQDKLALSADLPALCSAIMIESGLKEAGETDAEICEFFGADLDKTKNLL